MSDDLRTEVARAICLSDCWPSMEEEAKALAEGREWILFLPEADAAISTILAALREPTPEMVEAGARAAARAMGDEFANAFKNKQRWVAKRGMSGGRFRDINEPMQDDYTDAAKAALQAMLDARLAPKP